MDGAAKRLRHAKKLVRADKFELGHPRATECFPIVSKSEGPEKYEFIYCESEFFGEHEQSHGGMILRWGCKGIGFGEISFSDSKKADRLIIDTECMSDAFVNSALEYAVRLHPEYARNELFRKFFMLDSYNSYSR